MAAPVKRTLSVQDVARARALSATKGASSRPSSAGRALPAAAKATGLAIPGVGEAELALGALEKASEVLKGDLVTIDYPHVRMRRIHVPGTPRTGKKAGYQNVLAETRYTIHVNPITIGVGGIAVLVGGALGWLAWNGITISSGLGNKTTIAPGMKDNAYWKGTVDKGKKIAHSLTYTSLKGYGSTVRTDLSRTACEARGGIYNDADGTCTLPSGGDTAQCVQLHNAYNTFLESNDATSAYWVRQDAASKGCKWAQ